MAQPRKRGSGDQEADGGGPFFGTDIFRVGRLVERLDARVEALELENAALKGCLESSGALRPQGFLARLHQQRFLRAMGAHPCVLEASLSDVLLTRELRVTLGGYAGWPVVRGCAALERAVKELAGLIPHMLYVCGGFDGHQILASTERLDPRGCDWLDVLAQRRGGARQASASSSAPASSDVSCLCRCGMGEEEPEEPPEPLLGAMAQGSWEAVAPMDQQRAGFAAAVCTGMLYVCGGFDGQCFMRSAERFRPYPDIGAWEPVPPMSQRRHCATAASLAGRLYVCGGYSGEEALRSTELFDPTTDAWELVAPMAQRRHGGAAAVLGGRLFVCGGFDGEQALNSVERFDPQAGAWEPAPAMVRHRNMACAAGLCGRLYVCGGCDGKETLRTVECFDPEAGTWKASEPMLQRRHGAAAAVARGQLFVCGGGDSADTTGCLQQSVERLLPVGGIWLYAVPTSAPRIDMAVVSMLAPA